MNAVRHLAVMACLIGLALGSGDAGAAQAGAAQPGDDALVRNLRAGGLTLYFRHTETDWSKDDHIAKAGDWKSCDPDKVRQLSDKGRETAKAIGRAMLALKVPVTRVLSSEYCRAAETVRLMEIGAVETTTDIMNLRAADFVGGREAAVARLRRLLARPVPPGEIVVIGAHGNLIQAATGVYPGEGGGALFRADATAERGFTHVASLDPADWAELAKRFAP